MSEIYDALIIGCGPCGIGAAVILKNAGKKIGIIEKSTPGGKVNIAPRVDNYPRQKEIPGVDLAVLLYQRILDNNIELIGDEVLSLENNGTLFEITCKNHVFTAKTVLISSGTTERRLDLPNESKLFGHGLSYCAVCDGHFFKNKDVIVIGGGNSALKEAIYLAPIVNKLYLIHRRNEFRGNDKLVAELKSYNNVEVLTPYIPTELLGAEKVEGIKIQNKESGDILTLKLNGIFPLVGQIPNTQFINIEGVTNEWGTIPVDKKMMTSVSGLFAGGDVLPRDIRQIYLAEHDGMVAANSILEYLNK